VLELFERGVLDRQSIHFLYDLGLVPVSTKTAPLLLEHGGPDTGNDNELAMVPAAHTENHQRSMEASAIRSTLEHHEKQQQFRRSQSDPTGSAQQRKRQLSWSVEEHPLSLSRYQREFEQVGLLASGSFGQVFRAINKMDGHEYAVKRVSFAAAGYSRDSVKQVVREVHCLAACDHPHVVRYYTSWLEPSWMTGSNTSVSGSNNSDEESDSGSDKHHLKLLRDIHHMITSGEDSEALSDDLKAYFKGPSFGQTTQRRRSSMGGSFDDASASSWGHGEDYSEWTVDQSLDDIFVDGYRPRGHQQRPRRTQQNSSPLFQRDAEDDGQWRNPQKHKTSPNKKNGNRPHYRYQICMYIQMELCHPATLADWIRTRNLKLSGQCLGDRLEAAAEIFDQIVSGLSHVHEEKGIVHRDLKPANVFASADGLTFKIGDFGLSKLVQNSAWNSSEMASSPSRRSGQKQRLHQLLLLEYANQNHPQNQVGDSLDEDLDTSWQDPLTAGVGTASYAAPEQVASCSYGKEADIFSLGLILLELMCCFSTEHERLQTFHECRHRRALPPEFDNYPMIAQTILACTEPKAGKRPSAVDLKKLDLRTTTSHFEMPVSEEDEIEILRHRLADKEQELEGCKIELERKDQIIEDLRLQIETMNAGRSYHRPFHSPLNQDGADCGDPASSSSCSSEDGI
jgi:serine/threonine protein kinase